MKTRQIAETYGVSVSWARRVKQRRRETGEISHRRMESPDLNPIEMVFSKIKRSLRSLAARSRDALWGATQDVLDAVTSKPVARTRTPR